MTLMPEDVEAWKTALKMGNVLVFGLAFMWLILNLVAEIYDRYFR